MKNKFNRLLFYDSYNDFEIASFIPMNSYHWENEPPYRPETFFKLGVVDGSLISMLKCYENDPKAVFTERDAPVYQDSCLEFFLAPVDGRDEYINIETNSCGAFLCEFGKNKQDRALISSLTSCSPEVKVFKGEDNNGSFWGVIIKITRAFISTLYGIKECNISFEKVRANFYKCGDNCDIPHYIAFSPVTTLPPGFHNPECFAIFKK